MSRREEGTLLRKGSDEVMTQKVKEVFKENQLRNGVGDAVPQRQMNQAQLFYCLDFITPLLKLRSESRQMFTQSFCQ